MSHAPIPGGLHAAFTALHNSWSFSASDPQKTPLKLVTLLTFHSAIGP